jgi:hypothetical protein
MATQFPIKLAVTKIVRHNELLVEVLYDAVDATGGIIKHDYFYCKPADVEEVCAYTLERFSLALAQPTKAAALANVSFPNEATALLASMRAPEQTISPPGVGIPKATGK